ncbi:hypothetical protein QLS31_02445 [Flavobacterium sp. XS2P24]|uniref:hypothetical protein n=1 Tax=Flavobacterium sp. XS2P24 TaxID=3041249 RepID=UPI0024A9F0D6|nr:hypothetical protein [Flavobacterium sp. XS2P24]MDI6048681.1 hypothetical protein [Flavobacterium sp. XS2P24]
MNFENLLNTEKIVKDYSELNLDFNQSYLKSYPIFIDYFKSLDQIKYENLVISSHFVYGWMPTILHLGEIEIERTIDILNKTKTNQNLSYEDIELIKKNINNSMVGTSKLFHFINPENFAIWDSRIVRYITGNKYSYGIDKHENYIEYNYILKNVVCANHNIQEILKEFKTKFNHPISDLRAIELIIFEIDKNNN